MLNSSSNRITSSTVSSESAPKIVDEARVRSHFALIHTKFVHNYLFNPFFNGPLAIS